ncbi:hypothetical protein Leryth_015307 [Lithospermum erythrorhizon]|nr:hypothetical protein Leryth_015307 [Lithospermum erythrorhizon]
MMKTLLQNLYLIEFQNSSHVFKTHIIGENCTVVCGASTNKFLFSNENKLVEESWINCEKHFSLKWANKDTDFEEKLVNLLPFFSSGLIAIPIDVPGTPFVVRKIDLANGKVSPTQDILSQVISTSDENGEFMDERDVVNMLLGLLIEIMTHCFLNMHFYKQMEISNSKKEGELLSWNDINKRMKYSWSVASEVLRLDPPSPAGDFREALTDFN